MKRVIRDMHASEITIAYGQTESSPVITQTRTDDPIELRVSTVGRALPNVEVKIVDIETGATLPRITSYNVCYTKLLRLAEADARHLNDLSKLRLTTKVKRLIQRLIDQGEWVDAGQGFSGCEGLLQLTSYNFV